VRKTFKTEAGFTIIEIIAVLVILGILVATAVSRSVNYDAEVFTGSDTLKNHLRYAQTRAMNFNPYSGETIWGIRCDGTSYWLFQGTDPTDTNKYFRLPDDDKFINNNRTMNLSKKNITMSSFTVFFDSYGIPYSAYTNSTTNTPLNASLTINVSRGSSSRNVVITPSTGFIP